MRKHWFIALMGAALLAVMPATALAHGHHAKRHHRSRTHIRHITGADLGMTGTTGTSTPGTGSSSNDNAGRVTSFDGHKLVITLNDGSTVSGMVTNATALRCEAPGQVDDDSISTNFRRADHGGQGSSRDGNPGSDQGGQNNQGDRGGQNDQNDQGDQNDQNDQNDENGQAVCNSSNLTPGASVHQAGLAISSAGAVWQEVELA